MPGFSLGKSKRRKLQYKEKKHDARFLTWEQKYLMSMLLHKKKLISKFTPKLPGFSLENQNREEKANRHLVHNLSPTMENQQLSKHFAQIKEIKKSYREKALRQISNKNLFYLHQTKTRLLTLSTPLKRRPAPSVMKVR